MMSNKELKQLAKKQIKGNLFVLCIIALIVGLINGVATAIPVVGWIAIYFTSGVLFISISLIYLNLAKGKEPQIEDIQLGMKQWKEGAMLYLLEVIYLALWMLLLVVPGIIKAFAYSQAYYILAENPGMSASQALNESKKMMDGHKWELFMLHLTFIGWHILAGITCGLLYIYLAPYMNATFTNYYIELRDKGVYTMNN